MRSLLGKSGSRIPSLDGLRAISILLVLLSHIAGTRNAYPLQTLSPFGDIGNLGVRVFFVISGFLITTLLLDELNKTGRISLPWFYFRRTLRIFPANYVLVAAIGLASLAGWVTLSRYDLLGSFAYLQNYYPHRSWSLGHLWSLAVEEQFYLIWPATLALLGRGRAFKVVLSMLVFAPVVRIGMWLSLPLEWRELTDTAFPAVMDPLAIGCVLAIARKQLESQAWYMSLLASPVLAALPILAVAVNAPLVDRPRIAYAVGLPVVNLLIAIILHRAVAFPGNTSGRLLNWGPLQAMGVLSYSIYLWQQPFLNRNSAGFVNSFPVNIALVMVFAPTSYFLVESTMLRLRSRWEANLRGTLAPAKVKA
jgi:peptidoglycan/LPS O-acetylase OafA/YrhL